MARTRRAAPRPAPRAATGFQKIQLHRTTTVNKAPDPGSLAPGELAVELASDPVKLWVGVPTHIDADEQLLVLGDPVFPPGGLVLAPATGGAQGAGTINTTGVYVNGTQLLGVPSGGTQYQALIKGAGTAFGWAGVGVRPGNSTAVGNAALPTPDTGLGNVAFGAFALNLNNTGVYNVAIGYAAMEVNTNGGNNVAVGSSALGANTSGQSNVAIGIGSLNQSTSGQDNVVVGRNALNASLAGSFNIALGSGAGGLLEPSGTNTNPQESIYIGHATRAGATNPVNEIAIGHTAIGNGSNTITLGNDQITATYIGGRAIVNRSGGAPLRAASYGNSVFEAHGAFGDAVAIKMSAYGTLPVMVVGRAQGTPTAPTATANNNNIFTIRAAGFDGNDFNGGVAGITFVAAEAQTTAAQGGRIDFFSTEIGTVANMQPNMSLRNGLYLGRGSAGALTTHDMGSGTVNVCGPSAGYYVNDQPLAAGMEEPSADGAYLRVKDGSSYSWENSIVHGAVIGGDSNPILTLTNDWYAPAPTLAVSTFESSPGASFASHRNQLELTPNWWDNEIVSSVASWIFAQGSGTALYVDYAGHKSAAIINNGGAGSRGLDITRRTEAGPSIRLTHEPAAGVAHSPPEHLFGDIVFAGITKRWHPDSPFGNPGMIGGSVDRGNGAAIRGVSTEMWSDTARGTRLEFFNTLNGTATLRKGLALVNDTVELYGTIYNNGTPFLAVPTGGLAGQILTRTGTTGFGWTAAAPTLIGGTEDWTTGNANTWLGAEAGHGDEECVAIGYQALMSNSGKECIAIGAYSLTSNQSTAADGTQNVGIGTSALYSNVTGRGNLALGVGALAEITAGDFNTALGNGSGQGAGAPTGGIYIGYRSAKTVGSPNNEIVIGTDAIGNGSNTITLGNDDITALHTRASININRTTGPLISDFGTPVFQAQLQSQGPSLRLIAWGGVPTIAGRHATGSPTVLLPTGPNTYLLSVNAGGHDGTAMTSGFAGAAAICFMSSAQWSATSQGTRIDFWTTAVGDTGNTARASIHRGLLVGQSTFLTDVANDMGVGTINVQDGGGYYVDGKPLAAGMEEPTVDGAYLRQKRGSNYTWENRVRTQNDRSILELETIGSASGVNLYANEPGAAPPIVIASAPGTPSGGFPAPWSNELFATSGAWIFAKDDSVGLYIDYAGTRSGLLIESGGPASRGLDVIRYTASGPSIRLTHYPAINFSSSPPGHLLGDIAFAGITGRWQPDYYTADPSALEGPVVRANSALIRAVSTELWRDNARGSRLEFWITQNGTTAPRRALTIDHNGTLDIHNMRESIPIGPGTMTNNTGWNNIAIGEYVLPNNTANYNTAVGNYALTNNISGENNTAYGRSSLQENIAGSRNVAIGFSALLSNVAGNENVGVGMSAGGASTQFGDRSVYIGAESEASDDNNDNEIVIGAFTVGHGSNTITLGNSATTALHCQVQTITALSDPRLKEEIEPADLDRCLAAVEDLPVHRYAWKDIAGAHRDKHVTGWLPSDVAKIFPKAVTVSDTRLLEDCQHITMTEALPTLWGAVQRLIQRIEELERELRQ